MKREPWKETDVASAAMTWLQERGWDCYPEAQFQRISGRADIAATLGCRLAIVEAKVSANLAVLDQAARWIGRAHQVWIATPVDPGDTVRWICDMRGIGIMVTRRYSDSDCDDDGNFVQRWRHDVHVRQSAPLHRRALAADLIAELHPDMKRAVAGSQARRGGWSTPWSRTIDAARDFVVRNPGCTIRELVAGIAHHYASDAGARSTLMHWVDRFARRDGSRLYPLQAAA